MTITLMNVTLSPLVAIAVFAATVVTDAVYVFFTAAVTSRQRFRAANWSSIWYLLSAFSVISYTGNPAYVAFAALGSWVGAYLSVTWLNRAKRPCGRVRREVAREHRVGSFRRQGDGTQKIVRFMVCDE